MRAFRHQNMNSPLDRLKVKKLRKRFLITQVRLAYLLGVTAHTIANWESGRELPQGPMAAILKSLRLARYETAREALFAATWTQTLRILYGKKP